MKTKRAYRLKGRAKSQEETRRRIVEAAMHLHEELGPRATTISAIAGRAGVQRLTVYRHFPDETAVFQACTAHWLSLNPPPDPADWAAIEEPSKRLRRALSAFYRYYSATRRMWTTAHRDVGEVPALQRPMEDFAGLLSAIGADLSRAFGETVGDRFIGVTIEHALAFTTWADLDARGLDDDEKTRLAIAWIGGARRPPEACAPLSATSAAR